MDQPDVLQRAERPPFLHTSNEQFIGGAKMFRKTTYNYYDDRFKATALALGELTGAKAMDVAVVLGIHPVMLYRWKQEVRDGKIMKQSAKGTLDIEMRRELKRLKKIEKAHKTLQMEHELLEKSIQYSLALKRKSSVS